MSLYLMEYQNYDRSKLKSINLLNKSWTFQLWLVLFLMPLEVQVHTESHWKALRYSKYGSRKLRCCSTFSICQYVLKSDNLLHERGFRVVQNLRYSFLDFFYHLPIPNIRVFAFRQPPTHCKRLHYNSIHPKTQNK